jgi:hypothetical protein
MHLRSVGFRPAELLTLETKDVVPNLIVAPMLAWRKGTAKTGHGENDR